MRGQSDQRWAGAAGILSALTGAAAAFVARAPKTDDFATLGLLRATQAVALLVFLGGVREALLRAGELLERGRPSEVTISGAVAAGQAIAVLELVSAACAFVSPMSREVANLRPEGARDAAAAAPALAGAIDAVVGFPGAAFAALVSLGLLRVGRSAGAVAWLGLGVACVSLLRGVAYWPVLQRSTTGNTWEPFLPVGGSGYLFTSAALGVFVLVLGVFLMRKD